MPTKLQNYAVYFWPKGALASNLGSDTIFGAVCWGLHLLGHDVNQLLSTFQPPKFAFGSPCPVYDSPAGRLRFYRWPAWLVIGSAEISRVAEAKATATQSLTRKEALAETTTRAKGLSKLTYLSEALFQEAVTGNLTALQFFQRLPASGQAEQSPEAIERVGPAALSYQERAKLGLKNPLRDWLIKTEAVQHNHIDRVAGATVEGLLFYEQEQYFRSGAGLWCLLRTDETTLTDLIQPALRYLADTGLGANRSVGKGHFDIEVEPAPPLPDAGSAANGLVMLSRYLPLPGEWSPTASPLHYKLINLTAKREKKFARIRPGQKTLPIYKRSLRMLEAGCVVPYTNQGQSDNLGIYGQLAEVVPDEGDGRRTWQSGLAIGLPAKVEDAYD